MKKREYTIEVAGKTLTAQFNDLAEQASGSVMLKYGNTVVMANAVMGRDRKEGMDYFPLTVEYEERFYASGKILGSRFVRREGRPSDEATLSGRVVDRTIRPLFDHKMRNEVQVIITVLSIEQDDPDVLAVIASSLALATSNIPWNGPVSAVRIGKHKGDGYEINPTYVFREDPEFEMDLLACGKDGKINMIEVGAQETGEASLEEALAMASKEIEKLQEWQKMIVKEIGKAKTQVELPEVSDAVKALFEEKVRPLMQAVVMSNEPGKAKIDDLKRVWGKICKENLPDENVSHALDYYEENVDALIHKEAIENNKRPDGRGMDDLRPISSEVGGISPILHGTGIFYRGGTHILSVLTLGAPGDALVIDGMETQTKKRFMHHYNFPPYSTGETGRIGGLNRRAIGHGALAEKALSAVIPAKEVFPYTIRIVSEALSSNGSTSMGSVCGSSLALMDAGVPIKTPVAGIASGLMMKDDKTYKVLTDIQGPEDHHGDMDFKVAGTKDGVTAVQMDVKVNGVTLEMLKIAFEKAKIARLSILDVMLSAINAPRKDISPYAPKILTLTIKPDQIGMVIGTGGKVINEIRDTTGVDGIDIDDDGTVFITGKNGTAEKAYEIIAAMTKEFKAGEKYEGTITRIVDFGAFVRLVGNTEGLLHVSEIAPTRIDVVSKVLSVGEKIPVIVKEVNEGKIRLSLKDVAPDYIKNKLSQTKRG